MFSVTLPDNFSAKALFEDINSSAILEQQMFRAAMRLKNNGEISVVIGINHGCILIRLFGWCADK